MKTYSAKPAEVTKKWVLIDAKGLVVGRLATLVAIVATAGQVGYLLARAWTQLTRRISEAPSAIIMQFGGTFIVWILTEKIGLSGILTVVAYAITIARSAPARRVSCRSSP